MKKIEEYFLPLSDAEKVQKRTKRWLDEFDEEKSSYLKIKNELFLENKTILIRKHRRFAAYPLHSHQFKENQGRLLMGKNYFYRKNNYCFWIKIHNMSFFH